jgi:hypothetical protein
MDDNRQSRTTAAETVPDAAKQGAENTSEKAEEAARQIHTQSGSDSVATSAQEMPLEQAGDADQQTARDTVSEARDGAEDLLAAGRQSVQAVSRQFEEQPLLTLLAGFGMGYIIGLIIHGRR